jgi:ATP-dependent helicase HrpB
LSAGPPATPDTQPFDLAAIGADLAFARSLPELRKALDAGGPSAAAVVQAPPGTGKTTMLPPLMANLAGGAGRVVVTQPRRVAARAAARRLAALDASPWAAGWATPSAASAGPERKPSSSS